MNGADIASTILRGMHIAALASMFGVLVFTAVVVRTLPATPFSRVMGARLGRLGRASVTLALVTGAAWFAMQAAAISGAHSLRETLDAMPLVALETQFGQLLLARFALLLALLPLCNGLWRNGGLPTPRAPYDRLALATAVALAGGALGLQAATSHAGAIGGVAGRSLMISEALHVLAAGAWLGGLAPLLVVLATTPPKVAALAAQRFFPIGLVGVLVVATTSLLQAVNLVGSLPALVGTAYGRMALLKLSLFLVLLTFAALNRFVFSAEPGLRLQRSIIGETGVAVLVMLAAGALAHLTPGIHEQAAWPLPWRMDPASSGRLIAAYPTSFFVSPTGFDAAAIVRGERLYQAGCASCHGVTAQGDGPAAATLQAAPADLTARRVLDYGDGDLFWFVGHAGSARDEDRWDLVDYLRARNRGEFVRTAGRALHPLRVPRFNAVCTDGRAFDADGLRGMVLRVVASAGTPGSPIVESAGVTTITLATAAAWPDQAACVAQAEAREAFAILLGTTPDALAGSQFLVDANGWLRAHWRPGEPGGWATPELLAARVRALAAHPLPSDPAEGHAHHH